LRRDRRRRVARDRCDFPQRPEPTVLHHIEHAIEVKVLGNNGRQFEPTGDLYFAKRTCFVLTQTGIVAATLLLDSATESATAFPLTLRLSNGSEHGSARCLPSWEPERRALTFHGQIVKRFKWHAANQEMILSVFQEEGWPIRIDDPLAPLPTLDIKRRLSDTIKCLNRNQQHQLIRFHGDGTGQGVIWKASTAKIASGLE